MWNKNINIVLFALSNAILLFVFNAYSQEITFKEKHYSIANGLANNDVRDIEQDNTGYLWIATWDGVSRFDGYEFKNYYHQLDDSTTISYFETRRVEVDRCDNVWILASNSLCRYDRINDRFIRYQKEKESMLNDSVFRINTDKNKDLWIYGNKGIEKYCCNNNKFIKISTDSVKQNILNKDIFDFIIDDNDNIYLIFKSEVLVLSPSIIYNHPFYELRNKTNIEVSTNHPSNYLFRTFFTTISKNTTLIFTNTGTPFVFSGDNFTSLDDFSSFRSDKPLVWYNNGVFYYYKNGVMSSFKKPDVSLVEIMYLDNNQNIWLSYYNKSEPQGLYCLMPQKRIFHYINLPQLLNVPAVFSIYKNKAGNLFIADRNGSHALFIIKRNQKYISVDLPGLNNLLHIRSIQEDNDGRIWLGMFRNKIYQYDTLNCKALELDNIIPGNEIFGKEHLYRSYIFDKDKNLVLAGGHEITFIDIKKGKLLKTFQTEKRFNDIYCLYLDSECNIWGGMSGCFFRIDTLKRITFFEIPYKYNIESIIIDKSDRLWLALLGGGLCNFDIKTGRVVFTYTTKNGLPNNTTYKILIDRKGYLWISTDNGLSKFNPASGLFTNYGYDEGLIIKEFNADASFLDGDGTMYFGGIGGVVYFHPDSVEIIERREKLQAPLIISGITVSGEIPKIDRPVYNCKEIYIPAGSDNFQISFTCLDLINAEKIRYRYRLEGYNKQWIETDSKNRSVNYAHLPYGNYLFKVQATDNEGNWNKITSLNIVIPPFIYQTTWFKIITISFVIALFIFISNQYFRSVRLKLQKKNEELKLELLRGQMNPHFLYNSLNSVNYFISINDKLSANRYITDFSRLMRSFLNNSAKEFVPFRNEAEVIENYLNLEHIRFSDKFDYQISIDENLETENFEILPSIIQPFIENAIWHGVRNLKDRKGDIRVNYRPGNAKDYIICEITDDGIGRRKSAEQKTEEQKKRRSKGIEMTFERLRLFSSVHKHNYRIIINDLFPLQEETGTEVILEIPVNQLYS